MSAKLDDLGKHIARQVAINTPSAQHSDGCPRRLRPTGELFEPGVPTCTCWVIDAAELIELDILAPVD